MKKLTFALAGLVGLLGACDSSGTAPDGSGSARILDLKTEYSTSAQAPYQYVGCDVISNPRAGDTLAPTQVVLEFYASGAITSVEVQLRGVGSGVIDPDFRRVVNVADLQRTASGDYRVVLGADAATGNLLPLGITVQPGEAVRSVKPVAASLKLGEFYAELKVDTATSTISLSSEALRKIPVYQFCTLS